uniref:Reverse transcriptase domain-containing protein n=1 Tax=Nicotiana tabacum TaxID=4097 RepID=A0A1S3XLZ7_TOBAC|nr:PREDICTED: uncharacterized protein LOC107766425 [Nicotiana tabacum]
MVLHFYGGAALPKSITHTNLVLLPKKPRVETFSDLKPISLSNFINKVLSRVLHDILESFLPSLISPNQSGFVKGRSIFENILLTQEIVTDIRLRGKPANVVIKLDMAKAYDRSSGFFKYIRDVKQGDPLSPALFILSAEVLSRSLNKLFEDKSFVGFGIHKWSDPLNHLAYADDTIIFASAHPPSLRKIMAALGNYEKISGQMINKDKSSYYMHSKVANGLFQAIEAIIGFARGKFPFTYIGCPIFYTRKRKDSYEDLIKKVKAKLHSWKGKLLSFGGKATLISSMLQNMPAHMLSVLDPPNNILEHLYKTFARFFWSTKEEGRSRHWASWQNLCLPKEEWGLGFRSLHDVSRALFAKLWWRFRTTKSLWSSFMWNKYCKKELPTMVHFRGGSHVWRQIVNAREEVEHEIKVAELRQGEAWDDQLLDQAFNEEIAEHIRLNVHYEGSERYWDRPYWMPTPSGKFSVSSAWQILRHRADPKHEFKLMWIKGLPFKISLFLWRLWRQKIVTDDMWKRQGKMVMSRCWCCQQSQEESIEHMFVTSPTASKPLFQAVPTIITWELWKRRNAGKHGGLVSTNRVIHETNRTLHQLARVRAVDLRVTTNVVAEAKAILQGLEYCVEHDLHPFILEADSLVIEWEWDPPWLKPGLCLAKPVKANPSLAFTLQSLLKANSFLAIAVQSRPKASSCLFTAYGDHIVATIGRLCWLQLCGGDVWNSF